MKLKSFIIVCVCGAVFCNETLVKAANEYTAGHMDIGVALDNGTFDLHYHGDASTVIDGSPLGLLPNPEDYEFEASDLVTVVPFNPQTYIQFPSALPELGINPGDYTWVLSQNNQQAFQPFIGFAAEEIADGVLVGDTLDLQLTGFSGPGEMAIWQWGTFGPPHNFVIETLNGLSGDDTLSMFAGSHSHYNIGFTQPGIYDLTFEASGVLVAGGDVSGTATYRFKVVPEPVSVALLGVGALGLWRRRRN